MVYHFDLHTYVFVQEKRKNILQYIGHFTGNLAHVINKGITHKTTDTTQGSLSTCQASS